MVLIEEPSSIAVQPSTKGRLPPVINTITKLVDPLGGVTDRKFPGIPQESVSATNYSRDRHSVSNPGRAWRKKPPKPASLKASICSSSRVSSSLSLSAQKDAGRYSSPGSANCSSNHTEPTLLDYRVCVLSTSCRSCDASLILTSSLGKNRTLYGNPLKGLADRKPPCTYLISFSAQFWVVPVLHSSMIWVKDTYLACADTP